MNDREYYRNYPTISWYFLFMVLAFGGLWLLGLHLDGGIPMGVPITIFGIIGIFGTIYWLAYRYDTRAYIQSESER